MEFYQQIQSYAEEPITRQVLLDLLKDYRRPNDKLNELVRQGRLTNVKRGIYIPGPNLGLKGPEPFLLANHLTGPSYISMESALSHWGMIPERVFEITSATIKKSRTFQTAAGSFSYIHLPLPYYAFGIRRISLTVRQQVLIASPEKALCDQIIKSADLQLRSLHQTVRYLKEDLRIEEDRLRELSPRVISEWIEDAPKKDSLELLVKTLEKL